jgi:hypothetical protein
MKIDILATLVCSGNPITHNLKASTALSSPEQVKSEAVIVSNPFINQIIKIQANI